MYEPLIDDHLPGPYLTEVERREPYLSGSPQFTPWEENSEHVVEARGNAFVSERPRDTYTIPARAPRHRVAFFLQPTGVDGKWGDWWAAAFLMHKSPLGPERGFPQGIFTWQDDRRNIAVPPTESYGDYVGEADGVAPYGLE